MKLMKAYKPETNSVSSGQVRIRFVNACACEFSVPRMAMRLICFMFSAFLQGQVLTEDRLQWKLSFLVSN